MSSSTLTKFYTQVCKYEIISKYVNVCLERQTIASITCNILLIFILYSIFFTVHCLSAFTAPRLYSSFAMIKVTVWVNQCVLVLLLGLVVMMKVL